MHHNPQLSLFANNQDIENHPDNVPMASLNNRYGVTNDRQINDKFRQLFVQQQRLNYNHERLLEKYGRLLTPRRSEFRAFGSSSLPGRNYDEYLNDMADNPYSGSSLAALSRAGIGASDETYQWMGNESREPLPGDISSFMQHSRNEPMPFVQAEKSEPENINDHLRWKSIPARLRLQFSKKVYSRKIKNKSANKCLLNHVNNTDKNKSKVATTIEDNKKTDDHLYVRSVSDENWQTPDEQTISINPFLFDIFIQRLNGSIESYGQLRYTSLPEMVNYHRSSQHNLNTLNSPSSGY